MPVITVRLIPELDKSLSKVSEQTGIPKSSLILYALNDRIRIKKKIDGVLTTLEGSEPVRFSLRIPQSLKDLLEQVSERDQLSINAIVNLCVNEFQFLHWSDYLSDEEIN